MKAASAPAGGRVRVAITGIGLVTPLGTGTRQSWEALLAGRSGTAPITRFDASPFPTRVAAEVRDLDPERFVPKGRVRHMDRYSVLALAAARLALEDAGIPGLGELDRDRVAVVMGVGLGGLETLENMHTTLETRGPRFITPYLIPMMIPNMAAGWIAMVTGARGPGITVSTACASGAHAIGEGLRLLRDGRADMVIAGGSEAAVTPLGMGGFCAMRALSTRETDPEKASCPFDSRRDGFVLGEGAGVLVLERREDALERGARVHALLAGYGSTADAHDLTRPDPEGMGALRAMRLALEDAGMGPGDVDYVNAHATSTPLGDRVEAMAIRALLGERTDRVPVSSTKGATGHLLGAAGAVEAAFTALGFREGAVPHTLNLEEPDPECALDHVTGEPRRVAVSAALSNAFGFGGTNATLVIAEEGRP